VPLGLRLRLVGRRVEAGITCALCRATVDEASGRVVEGARRTPTSRSASSWRPRRTRPPSSATPAPIRAASHRPARRGCPIPDLVNNPSQIPTAYTFGAWPYGWNGFASIGWFHGLSTLGNNVHALNADPTTGADVSEPLLGLDKETYLGVLLQNAAQAGARLPEGVRPSEFLARIDPTPGTPGTIAVVPMPDHPRGSLFIPDGLLASNRGRPFASEINALSAWQLTLAPPRSTARREAEAVGRGARVFERAGCARCHAGRWLTRNDVIPQPEVGTQPSRARALAAFPRVCAPARTWTPGLPVPLAPGAPSIAVPEDLVPAHVPRLAYNIGAPAGGYKIPSLLGLHVSAPYLHDGGVAVGAAALTRQGDRIVVTDPTAIGLAGTLMRGVRVDAAASLRALVDHALREAVVAANARSESLGMAHVSGAGHPFWVDAESGYSTDEQSDLVTFLLSLDDDPPPVP
jgi:hypothetical protein